MKKVRGFSILASVLAGVLLLTAPLHAETEGDAQEEALDQHLALLKQDLVSRRNASLRAILQLDSQQAMAFAPLQNGYDEELAKLGETRRELLREYRKIYNNLTPEGASELADRFFQLDRDRIALQRKYFKLMSEKVNTVVAAQFLQLQHQFETMGDVKLASRIPLASQGSVDEDDEAAQSAALDQYLETVKKDLTSSRDAALANILQMGDSETKEFEALKKSYDKEFATQDKANQKLLKEWKGVYQKLTPEAANSIADRVFTLDEERVDLHQKYLGLMSEKVSTVVAVQFLQVQRRFEKMADLKASTYIPIAGM